MAGSEALATRHARRLLALMSDTLAAAYLVETGARGAQEGDRRSAFIARFMVEECLASSRGWRIDDTPDWLAPRFGSIIRHQPID